MRQDEALQILKMGHNIFLTGAAGSGKTHVLNTYIDYLRKNDIEVGITASTGTAATHIGGTTIHSWSGIGVKDNLTDTELRDLSKKSYLRSRFKKAKVLLIDEISMLKIDQFDLIDRVCRVFTGNMLPFGGLQIILVGDFFQLPPVDPENKENLFVYKGTAWNNLELKICYLHEQYRQEDQEFLGVLSDIRNNVVNEETLVPLRQRYRRSISGVTRPTKLYTHNAQVDVINSKHLQELEGHSEKFEMDAKGSKKIRERLIKGCLAPEVLELKEDAVVMFVKNNFDKGYVNGTIGTVEYFESENGYPAVRTKDGRLIIASPEVWVIEEDGKIKAELSQIPLRLAWAITVHKSQGMSLDAAEIDLTNSFTPGMGYVALSRVRALSGLKLMGLNDTALRVHPEILDLDTKLQELSEEACAFLENLNTDTIKEKHESFVRKNTLRKEEKLKKQKLSTYEITKKYLDEKKQIDNIAKERGITVGTVISHIEKLQEKGEDIKLDHIKAHIKKEHLKEIEKAFEKEGMEKLSPAFKHLKGKYDFDTLRLVRTIIKRKS